MKKIIILLFLTFSSTNGIENNTIETETSNNTTKRLYKLSDYEDSLYIQDLLRAAKAAEMKAYLSENINPCSNFYEFACGNFRKFHARSSILQIIEDGYEARIESLLNISSNAFIDTKLKLFLKSCLNVTKTQIASSYKTKLLSIIAEFGKMPILSGNTNWNESEFDWIAMIAKMHRKYNKKAIIALNIAADIRDNRIHCLYIGQPKLLLPMKSMYSHDNGKFYKSVAKAVIAEKLQYFLNVPEKLAEQTATEIIEFEVLLAKGIWDGKTDYYKMNTPTSTFYLSKKYAPTIDIKRFLILTLGITQTNCMYEHVASYQENLKSFIEQIPKHVIANYLFFMLLNDEFFLQIKDNEKAQKRVCFKKVKKYFPKLLDNFIYRHSKTEQLENDFKMIFNNLKETLLRNFTSDQCEWLKPKSRYSAIEKLDELRLEFNTYVGSNLRNEFKELNFTENDYIENVKRLLLLKGKQFIRLLNTPAKSIDSGELVSSIPIYLIQQNLIKVPVTLLLQNILWTHCFPIALKFAQIGTLLGHELIHGFDDEGRKYDKRGSHQNWWDLDTMQAFNEHKKCFLEQSKQYHFSSNYLHDDFLLSEIIADNGGIRLAYDAYMRWYNDTNRILQDLRRESFSTLKFTHQQLFFISYAQFWCSDISETLVDLSISKDVHSPNMYRVIGSLHNMPEFSAAFKCRNTTNMNPVKKCRVF